MCRVDFGASPVKGICSPSTTAGSGGLAIYPTCALCVNAIESESESSSYVANEQRWSLRSRVDHRVLRSCGHRAPWPERGLRVVHNQAPWTTLRRVGRETANDPKRTREGLGSPPGSGHQSAISQQGFRQVRLRSFAKAESTASRPGAGLKNRLRIQSCEGRSKYRWLASASGMMTDRNASRARGD